MERRSIRKCRIGRSDLSLLGTGASDGDPMLIELGVSEGVGRYGATQRVKHENWRDLRLPPGDPQFLDLVREAVRESRSQRGRRGVSHRAGRVGLTLGQGWDPDRIPGQASPQ